MKQVRRLGMFVEEWRRNPGQVGAAIPSSPQLAKCMADLVPRGDGWVIELGAGTGVITEGLLRAGLAPSRLLAIELGERMAHHLKERHPGIHVRQGSADRLGSHLREVAGEGASVRAIVSGLPLRSLPLKITALVAREIERTLGKGAYIQFTYDLTGRPFKPLRRLQRESTAFTWVNLPPARVDRFYLGPADA